MLAKDLPPDVYFIGVIIDRPENYVECGDDMIDAVFALGYVDDYDDGMDIYITIELCKLPGSIENAIKDLKAILT